MSELKIDLVDINHSLLDKYYPILKEFMKINEKKILRYISNYRDKNSDILSSPYPVSYPIFSPEDNDTLIKLCGIDKKEAIKDFSNSEIPDNINRPPTNYSTFPMISIMLMKYYIESGEKEKLNLIYRYFSYSIYWVIFTSFFSKFPPRESTMIYTVNNLSNKFKLKQLGSIDALLFSAVESTIESSKDRVLRCSNAEIYYVANLCRNAINNFMRAITNEYMNNYMDKKVILASNELLEDGSKRNTVTLTSDVEVLAQEYTAKFFSRIPNQDLIKTIAKVRSVSANELKNTLMIIIDRQAIDEVKKFYQALFYLYFSDTEKDHTIESIKSMDFVATMESIYKKGNSANKNIVYIKDIMNKWLNDGSLTYKSSVRGGTLNEFKKAVYYYYIFSAASNK